MCSQNARKLISEPQILKIFQGACPRTPIEVTKDGTFFGQYAVAEQFHIFNTGINIPWLL